MTWVDYYGNPVKVGGEMAACDHDRLQKIRKGELIGDISELLFRDPNRFRVGELHNHFEYWQYIAQESPSPQQAQILGWIKDKVSIQLAKVLNHDGASGRLATSSAENVVVPWQDVNQLKRFVCAFPVSEQRKRPAE